MEALFKDGLPAEATARLGILLEQRGVPSGAVLVLRRKPSSVKLFLTGAVVAVLMAAAAGFIMAAGWSRLTSKHRIVLSVGIPAYLAGGYFCVREMRRPFGQLSLKGIASASGGKSIEWADLYEVVWNEEREVLYFYTENGKEVTIDCSVPETHQLRDVFLPPGKP
jgi:hypothetical protein